MVFYRPCVELDVRILLMIYYSSYFPLAKAKNEDLVEDADYA